MPSIPDDSPENSTVANISSDDPTIDRLPTPNRQLRQDRGRNQAFTIACPRVLPDLLSHCRPAGQNPSSERFRFQRAVALQSAVRNTFEREHSSEPMGIPKTDRPSWTRRDFVQAGLIAAGAVGMLPAFAAVDPVPDLDGLAHSIRGRFCVEGSPGYEEARKVWNRAYDRRRSRWCAPPT